MNLIYRDGMIERLGRIITNCFTDTFIDTSFIDTS